MTSNRQSDSQTTFCVVIFKMKIFVGLITTLLCSVIAELSPALEKALHVKLRKIHFSHFRNMTEFAEPKGDHPHAHMNVIQIGEYYNYGTETHTVLTDDGYILEMHRFTGNQKNPKPKGKQPVLLMHGLLCSSADWVMAGPGKGFAFILADLGYDVWMGNARGNRYSLRHNNTSIAKSVYWDFTFHEIGKHDLPAMIDHILKRTGYKKIFCIGHSQGTATFLSMLSQRPEYNDKIITMFLLAPVAFLSHMTSPVFKTLATLNPAIDVVMRLLGKYEFDPPGEFFKKFASFLCDETHITQPICSNVMFMICGYSNELLDQEMLPVFLAHVPAGSSTKQFLHLSQLVISGHFREFDYGWWKNLQKYNSITPPSYNFNNIKAPISLHYASNDWLSNPADVEKLRSKLPNVIGKFRVPHDTFNHLDFVWGLKVKSLLYDKIISIMKHQEKLHAEKCFKVL